MTIDLLLPVALVGYIVGIVSACLLTIYRALGARRVCSWVYVVTWLAQLAVILRAALTTGRLPLSNLAGYLLVLGWVVLTLHLFVWFKLRVDVAGLILPTLAGIMTFAAMQLASPTDVVGPAQDGWFLVHTTVSTLGMAILTVAFTMSLIYLVQDRALKARKTLQLLERLPPLQESDQIGFRALTIGFVLLTIGIGTGIVVNAEVYHQLWIAGPKQIFPLLSWLVFAAILLSRPLLGLRGRKSAYLTIAGFALGLLTVLGMTL